jgi:hypothetical protein
LFCANSVVFWQTRRPSEFFTFRDILKVPDSMQDAPPDIPCPGALLYSDLSQILILLRAQHLILRRDPNREYE